MKKWLLICGILSLGLHAALAADPALVFEDTPLPAGPLINRVSGFSKWQIDFHYAKSTSNTAVTTAEAAKPSGSDRPKQVTVTRTKPRWHAMLVLANGTKTESWFDGATRYAVGPEPTTVIPIAEFTPNYNPAFLEYTSTDFPDVEWVSAKTYLGTQKDTAYWVFQQAEGGPMVWIDSQTRFPVRWQKDSEVRVFKFLATPQEPLKLPDSIAKLSDGLQRLKRLSDQVPPHR